MSKSSAKEDTGFGFKDKAKAEETLELLEAHDMKYRKLTVRGLLGRAKRVLSLTKAEDKLKNIKAAMEVFENWLSENNGEASTAPAKKPKTGDSEEPEKAEKTDKKPDTVPGLGFKDGERAEETLRLLQGRDPEYQKLAIKGLIGSAKRVLPATKAEDKINNINEAIEIFDKFLDDFESKNMIKEQKNYLAYSVVKAFKSSAEKHGAYSKQGKEFVSAYEKVDNYKHLRTVHPADSDVTWDIIRNKELQILTEKVKEEGLDLFEDKEPTKVHLEMIMWAYSPSSSKIKSLAEQRESDEKKSLKRKSGGSEDDSTKKRK